MNKDAYSRTFTFSSLSQLISQMSPNCSPYFYNGPSIVSFPHIIQNNKKKILSRFPVLIISSKEKNPKFSTWLQDATGSSFICNFINYSVQFSHSVMSDSLWPHEAQHARPPCPSPTPRVHPNPCPLSRWCHPLTVTFPLTHRTRTPQPRVFVLAFLPQLFK